MDFQTNTSNASGNFFLKKMPIVAAQVVPDDFNDINLELTFPEVALTGREPFSPKMHIRGKYHRDETGAVTGLGSLFKIPRLFERLGIEMKFSSETGLPQEAVEQLVGREIWTIQYKAHGKEGGKTYYRFWEFINDGNWEKGGERLLDEFKKSFSSPWPPYKYAGSDQVDPTSFPPTDTAQRTSL